NPSRRRRLGLRREFRRHQVTAEDHDDGTSGARRILNREPERAPLPGENDAEETPASDGPEPCAASVRSPYMPYDNLLRCRGICVAPAQIAAQKALGSDRCRPCAPCALAVFRSGGTARAQGAQG